MQNKLSQLTEQLTQAKARAYDCLANRDMWQEELNKANKEVGRLFGEIDRVKLDEQQSQETPVVEAEIIEDNNGGITD